MTFSGWKQRERRPVRKLSLSNVISGQAPPHPGGFRTTRATPLLCFVLSVKQIDPLDMSLLNSVACVSVSSS